MALVDEIKDRESLEAWLETQPKEVAVDIAHRAAMRVLPLYWDWVSRQDDLTTLPILRLSLTNGIAARSATPLIKPVHDYATSRAYPAARFARAAAADVGRTARSAITAVIAANAATSAANAATAAASAAAAFWAAVRTDAELTEALDDPLTAPLWHEAQNPLDLFWQDVLDQLPAEDAGWDFWRRWYQGALDAQPLDQDLIKEIANQGEEFWEGTDDEVNARIAAIVAEHERAAVTLADAAIFDFIEFNHRLKMVGFPRDLSPFEDAATKRDFLADSGRTASKSLPIGSIMSRRSRSKAATDPALCRARCANSPSCSMRLIGAKWSRSAVLPRSRQRFAAISRWMQAVAARSATPWPRCSTTGWTGFPNGSPDPHLGIRLHCP